MKDYGNGYQVPNRVGGVAPRIGFGWDVLGDGKDRAARRVRDLL